MRLLASTVVSLALLAPAAAAQGDAFDRILRDYQQTGRIDPCKHAQADLENAQDNVPNDVEAYAPDFPNALQYALEQRAGGACTPAAQDAEPAPGSPPAAAGDTPAPPAPGSTSTPAPGGDPTPAAVTADGAIARTAAGARASDAGTPAPVVALAVIGALLALGGLAYGLAYWLAWDPRWARATRHAFAEAGWRTGNTWSEFTDWVRLGR